MMSQCFHHVEIDGVTFSDGSCECGKPEVPILRGLANDFTGERWSQFIAERFGESSGELYGIRRPKKPLAAT